MPKPRASAEPRPGGPVRVLSRNDWFQRIDAVKRNRVKRKQYGECLVESVAAIDAAAREGWEFRAFLHADGARLSRWAADTIASSPAALTLALAPHLMAELSDREDTSELLALVAIRRPSVEAIPAASSFAALLLDRPASPGNLGSILRSADAFGATGIAIRGHAADLYDPQTIRSSLGAVFSVPVAPECSNEAIVGWTAALRAGLPRFQVIGTSPAAGRAISAVDLRRPTLVVLGNERTGMSEWLRAQVDETARIPTGGRVDSLNLAAAATVLLYEIARQRGGPQP